MIRYDLLEQFCREREVFLEKDVPLRERCTFKIGGPAPLILEPSDAGQIADVMVFAREHDIPLVILGRGSNILFPDEGIPEAVLCLGERFSKMERTADGGIACESGALLSKLCTFACENGLSGLEFAFGIPGTVGGAAYMNAGAYDGEMKDVLVGTEHIDESGKPGRLEGAAMGLSYRRSAYADGSRVITRAHFRLNRADPAEIRAKMDDFMNRRKTKQPLEYPSAGSTFKRPEGAYASALIDQCGLRGRSVGGAAVSEKHAGFVINTGGATSRDVRELMELVRREVHEKTGYLLEPEVKIMG